MKKLTLLFTVLFISLIGFGQSEKLDRKVTFDFTYTGENAAAFDIFLQKQSIYYFKGKNVRYEMIGGMAAMMGSILMDGDKRIAYSINDSQKTAYIMDRDTSDNQTLDSDPSIVITETKETEVILGHKCKKYKVLDKDANSIFFIWITTDIEIKNPEEYGGAAAGLFFPSVKGIMLKKEHSMVMSDGTTITAVQKVSSIDETTQDATLFRIPADYKIKEFDPTAAFGGGKAGY